MPITPHLFVYWSGIDYPYIDTGISEYEIVIVTGFQLRQLLCLMLNVTLLDYGDNNV